MPARTRKMTRTEVRTRAQHAHAFLTAADLVVDLGHHAGIDDLGNTIGSLAVLAGIAAGDAICGAVLGERAAGQDHGNAVAMLRRTEPGKRLAQHLARLIDSKTETQHSPLLLTEARAADLLKAARRLVDGMDDVLRTLS
ncbi:hypothetical protein [Agromyces sp. NPDC049794]|uniref:hypothetical protein n=2 Tax=unclassified Agromyces TaxID=2639701 RepID=UPI0033EB120E